MVNVSVHLLLDLYTELKWYFGTFSCSICRSCILILGTFRCLPICRNIYIPYYLMYVCIIFINDSAVEYTVDSMVLLARKRLESGSKSDSKPCSYFRNLTTIDIRINFIHYVCIENHPDCLFKVIYSVDLYKSILNSHSDSKSAENPCLSACILTLSDCLMTCSLRLLGRY